MHRGALTVDVLERAVIELELRFADAPLSGLIVDLRDVSCILSNGEYLSWLKNRGGVAPVASRVAIVSNPDNAAETAFMEIALQNRGVTVWKFDDNREALRWLFRPDAAA